MITYYIDNSRPTWNGTRKVGGTRKIADVKPPCMSPSHNPPNMMVYPPGVYEHTCPACGFTQTFTVHGIYC
jgi:hypothetical protein